MNKKYFFIKRQKAISEFLARLDSLKLKGANTQSLHDFALGVCLCNKGIAKGFLSRLNSKYPDLTALVRHSLTIRENERLKSIRR